MNTRELYDLRATLIEAQEDQIKITNLMRHFSTFLESMIAISTDKLETIRDTLRTQEVELTQRMKKIEWERDREEVEKE